MYVCMLKFDGFMTPTIISHIWHYHPTYIHTYMYMAEVSPIGRADAEILAALGTAPDGVDDERGVQVLRLLQLQT